MLRRPSIARVRQIPASVLAVFRIVTDLGLSGVFLYPLALLLLALGALAPHSLTGLVELNRARSHLRLVAARTEGRPFPPRIRVSATSQMQRSPEVIVSQCLPGTVQLHAQLPRQDSNLRQTG
jgi:hypothetical protein